MTTPTPPHQMPAITADTKIRTSIGTIVSVSLPILGAAIWLTMMYSDIQRMKKVQQWEIQVLLQLAGKEGIQVPPLVD